MAISAKQNRATVSTELQAQPTDGAEQGARSLQLIVLKNDFGAISVIGDHAPKKMIQHTGLP